MAPCTTHRHSGISHAVRRPREHVFIQRRTPDVGAEYPAVDGQGRTDRYGDYCRVGTMGRCPKTSPAHQKRLGGTERLHGQYLLSRPDTDRYRPDALGEHVPGYGPDIIQPAWRR